MPMCIIFCDEHKDHRYMKQKYKDIVFAVIDHRFSVTYFLERCFSKLHKLSTIDSVGPPTSNPSGSVYKTVYCNMGHIMYIQRMSDELTIVTCHKCFETIEYGKEYHHCSRCRP